MTAKSQRERHPAVGPSSDERDPVELLADEFLGEIRRGGRPTIEEYAARHPDLADAIRDLFPALLMMENLGERSADATGPCAPGGAAIRTAPPPARLGDYRILREIGRGGMGVVYEAEQGSLGRRVALKVLSTQALASPQQARRFEREARAAGRLHHTNIVPVFGVGREDDTPYYVMQYIPGQPLSEVIVELRRLRDRVTPVKGRPGDGMSAADVAHSLWSGAMSRAVNSGAPGGTGMAGAVGGSEGKSTPEEPTDVCTPLGLSDSNVLIQTSLESHAGRPFFRTIAKLGIQAAEALDYAAGQGVLHRDVKPSNLLLDVRGTLWVTDFGLAKLAGQDDLTQTGDLLGTLRYMAPERFRGRTDIRSDVYGLGLTLYELLALRPAFDEADRSRLIHLMNNSEPPNLLKLDPAIPRDLATVVHKAIAREPSDRYPTAGGLAEDLRRFLEDRPIAARRLGPLGMSWRWCRRNPAVAALAALAATLLVTVAAVSSVGYARVSAALRRETAALGRETAALGRETAARRERDRQLQEKDRNLYHALVGEARGLRLARVNGFREQVFSLLRRALQIPTPDRDVNVLRQEAVACLGDFVGFAPRDFPLLPERVTAIAPHPRDDLMAIGLIDGTLLLCRQTTGTEVTRLSGHLGEVTALAFGPDGETLVSGDMQGAIQVWSREGNGWRCRGSLKGDTRFSSLVITPDGRRLAARAPRTSSPRSGIAVWDLADLTPAPGFEAETPEQQITGLAQSPDGRLMVAGYVHRGERGGVLVWDVATRRVLRSAPTHGLISTVTFSPDSELLACSSGNGFYTFEAVSLGRRSFLAGMAGHAAFSPDGQLLALSTIYGLRLRNVATNDEVAALSPPEPAGGPAAQNRAVAFSPDGRTLFASFGRVVRSWDLAPTDEKRTLAGHSMIIEGLSFSPDGKFLASVSSDGILILRDAATGQVLRRITVPVGTMWVAFSPDGTLLVTCDRVVGRGGLHIRSVPSLEEVLEPASPMPGLKCVKFSPDGRVVAACGDGGLWVWRLSHDAPGSELPSRLELVPDGHEAGPSDFLCFSPDGTRIARPAGRRPLTARLWDVELAREIPFGGPAPLAHYHGLAFLPDGRHLAMITGDGIAEVWEIETGRRAFTLGGTGEFMKSHVALSPDGCLLAGGHTDTAVSVWDLTRRRRLFILPEELGLLSIETWSPDGSRLAIGLKDGSVVLWDLSRIRDELKQLDLDW
jgi:WD40 repeat protein/serine/threonine protein kinase